MTGASGLVGANLVRSLLEQGRDVRALVHADARALSGLGVETVSADLRAPASLERAMRGVDVVYHLAGAISLRMDSGPEMESINVLGTRNVVETCLRLGVRRLLHFSSIQTLRQEPLDQPVDENRSLIDVDDPALGERIPPYDRSKALGEREVRAGMQRGLDAVILYPTAILGPNDFKPSYLGQALIQLAQGRIPALVLGGFDWVDVRDVVTGALGAEEHAPPGARYILGGRWHTIREVAQLAASFTGRSAPSIAVPLALADAFAPVVRLLARFNNSQPIYTRVTLHALRSNRSVSHALAEKELGYSPRPLSESVHDTLGWFLEHGYMPGKG